VRRLAAGIENRHSHRRRNPEGRVRIRGRLADRAVVGIQMYRRRVIARGGAAICLRGGQPLTGGEVIGT